MGEKMTLEQVRDWHLERVRRLTSDQSAGEHYQMAGAIDAHLTQPAQAVDVGAIRAVIAWLRRQEGMRVDPDHVAEAITAAIPKDSNGAEGV